MLIRKIRIKKNKVLWWEQREGPSPSVYAVGKLFGNWASCVHWKAFAPPSKMRTNHPPPPFSIQPRLCYQLSKVKIFRFRLERVSYIGGWKGGGGLQAPRMMSHICTLIFVHFSRDQDASLCIGCELNAICLDPDIGKNAWGAPPSYVNSSIHRSMRTHIRTWCLLNLREDHSVWAEMVSLNNTMSLRKKDFPFTVHWVNAEMISLNDDDEMMGQSPLPSTWNVAEHRETARLRVNITLDSKSYFLKSNFAHQ